jgi:hypothetical protein
MFESSTKKSNYSNQDIRDYLEKLEDLNLLEFRQETKDYVNHGRNWVFAEITAYLKL